jgi:hypothetical protein
MVPAVSQFSTVHSKSKIAKRMHAQDPDDKLVCCTIQQIVQQLLLGTGGGCCCCIGVGRPGVGKNGCG